jgi:enterochelin esterase-like enzyme
MRRGRRVLALVVLLPAVGVAGAVARGRIDRPRRAAHATRTSAAERVSVTCRSPSLGGSLPAIVYLPAGYRSGSSRYRVIYFLHGLPANASSYKANQFVGAAVSSGRNAAIVVAPQGARSDQEDHEYLDLDATENWPRAISHDLTSRIASRFRTVANRSGRALVGRFADDNEALDRALAREGIPHLFRTYPGGHSGALWTSESKLWLGYALGALARGA